MSQRILKKLLALDRKGEEDFLVLDHDSARHDASRPLVVIVHPGDMIE